MNFPPSLSTPSRTRNPRRRRRSPPGARAAAIVPHQEPALPPSSPTRDPRRREAPASLKPTPCTRPSTNPERRRPMQVAAERSHVWIWPKPARSRLHLAVCAAPPRASPGPNSNQGRPPTSIPCRRHLHPWWAAGCCPLLCVEPCWSPSSSTGCRPPRAKGSKPPSLSDAPVRL
ncbi:hypothetical protein VPH35_122775 [Triticum aestivum]